MQKVKSIRPAKRFSCLPLLWVILFILLAVAQSAHGQAVKILPLGDSLTSGLTGVMYPIATISGSTWLTQVSMSTS